MAIDGTLGSEKKGTMDSFLDDWIRRIGDFKDFFFWVEELGLSGMEMIWCTGVDVA